jgi:hypothetical protein
VATPDLAVLEGGALRIAPGVARNALVAAAQEAVAAPGTAQAFGPAQPAEPLQRLPGLAQPGPTALPRAGQLANLATGAIRLDPKLTAALPPPLPGTPAVEPSPRAGQPLPGLIGTGNASVGPTATPFDGPDWHRPAPLGAHEIATRELAHDPHGSGHDIHVDHADHFDQVDDHTHHH